MPPSSGREEAENARSDRQEGCHACSSFIAYLTKHSALKMETLISSEASLNAYPLCSFFSSHMWIDVKPIKTSNATAQYS